MKDMGVVKQILRMSIVKERVAGSLKLSKKKYIQKVLKKFSMTDEKRRSTPLGSHIKLSKKQSPNTDEDRKLGMT